MSETKFTPGPWRQQEFESKHESCYLIVNCDDATDLLANCQTEANAHLIAAAPELYEFIMDEMPDFRLSVREEAVKLLAKARGEQNV